MFVKLLVLFFILNALFWGLFPHEVHCQVVEGTFGTKCPSHMVHIIIGIVSFLAAVYLTQKQYMNSLFFGIASKKH